MAIIKAADPSEDFEPVDPEVGEDEETFMARCTTDATNNGLSDGDAGDACQEAWDDAAEDDMPNPGGADVRNGQTGIIYRTHAANVVGMEFVLSDETVDRYGDVISADGWDLKSFRNNPIALFSHRSDFPIGRWADLRVIGKQLRGHLELAPEGTSARIDELRKLVDAGILKAVSVGFHPKASEPLKKSGGELYTKSELVECSLVSVPANQNALAVAKALKISDETLSLAFRKHAGPSRAMVVRTAPRGKQATTTKIIKPRSPVISQDDVNLGKFIAAGDGRLQNIVKK